jgi:hypothetical protein
MKHELNTDGEEFLIFDFRFLIGNGEKFGAGKQVAGPEAGAPTKTREAGGGGKRRYGSGAFTCLRDQEIGKWCSFSHLETALTRLFPHKSTQVVDFPHLGYVRHFLDANFANERELGKTKQNHRGTRHRGRRSLHPRWEGELI